jgi:hypothetical protein
VGEGASASPTGVYSQRAPEAHRRWAGTLAKLAVTRPAAMIGSTVMVPAGAFSRKATFVALVGVLAALTVAVALPRAQAAAPSPTCPTFRVLHNDRIGKVILPAGTYDVRIAKGAGLSCAKASDLFTRFLEDYDGVLPHQWRARQKGAGKAAFIRKGKRRFSVIHTSSGVGGGGQGGSLGSLCPGKFHVLHDDHIGPLFFNAGFYQLYIPRHSVISCQRATALFTKFLALPNGRLPHGWRLKSQRAIFFRAKSPAHKRFRVDPGT